MLINFLHISDVQVPILGNSDSLQAEFKIRVRVIHLVIDFAHNKIEEVPGDVRSSEGHVQEHLD